MLARLVVPFVTPVPPLAKTPAAGGLHSLPALDPKCYNYSVTGHLSRDCTRPRYTPAINEVNDTEVVEASVAYTGGQETENDSLESGNDYA